MMVITPVNILLDMKATDKIAFFFHYNRYHRMYHWQKQLMVTVPHVLMLTNVMALTLVMSMPPVTTLMVDTTVNVTQAMLDTVEFAKFSYLHMYRRFLW